MPSPLTLTRRSVVVGLLGAGPAAAADSTAPRLGPGLFRVEGDGPASGFSTYSRHIAAGTAPGVDFRVPVDPTIVPIAPGVVASVKDDRVSGITIVIDHGVHLSRYAHLARADTKAGAPVGRRTRIGAAGGTGIGAWVGPHLHLDLSVDARFAALLGLEATPRTALWLDPTRLAAVPAVDVDGNASLPYPGELQLDTDDAAWRRATRRAEQELRALASDLPEVPAREELIYGIPAGAPGRGRRIHHAIHQCFEALPALGDPSSDRDAILAVLQAVIDLPPRLTAPFYAG